MARQSETAQRKNVIVTTSERIEKIRKVTGVGTTHAITVISYGKFDDYRSTTIAQGDLIRKL